MASGLQINLEFDSNAMAAPASFRAAVEAAASALDAAIDDPITVNVVVGYGEYDLGGPEFTPLTDDESLGGVNNDIPVSYSLLRAALLANAQTPSEIAAIKALPNTTTLNGQSEFFLAPAEAKALGVISATSTLVDGYVGFPTSFTGTTLTSAAITELAHAIGLLNGGFPLSLVEYTSPGTHFLASGTTNMPVYFSLDGGNTVLADYDGPFDSTLFENVPNDPLTTPITGATTLTALDLSELGALGFNVTSPAALASPTITPTASPPGSAPVVTAQDISVGEDASVAATAMIKSVSAAAGDSIAYYGFYDQGGDNGFFSVNGVVEPDDQWIYVLSTQLDAFDYVGGTTTGSETLFVYASDYTSNTNSVEAEVTATTTAHVAPTVKVRAVSVWENATVAASNMIVSVSNPGGDSITKYGFYDHGGGTGHLTIGGVTQADGKWINVTAADLDTVDYVGGTSPGKETISVRVYDATTKSWSVAGKATATTTVEPVVKTHSLSVAEGASIAASGMIASISNPSGDKITKYRFYDHGGGTGHFTVGGVAQADNKWIYVPATDLSGIKYVGGASAGSQSISIEVYDATTKTYSANAHLTATTTTASGDAVAVNSVTAVGPGQPLPTAWVASPIFV